MHHVRSLALVLAAAAAVAATPAARTADADRYALDPVHTRVVFAVSHAGFSDAIGTVSGSTGTLVFDPDDWCCARLDVSVPIARLDLGDAKWNAAALAANLLDGARYPEARFISDTFEPVAATGTAVAAGAKVCGQLTLHGISRPLCMDVVLNALKRHPLPPFRRTAGFSATATLSRSDYGITAWKSVIGDRVELRIEAEAVRRGSADSAADDPEPDDPEPATGPPSNPAESESESKRDSAPESAPPPDDLQPPAPPAEPAIVPVP